MTKLCYRYAKESSKWHLFMEHFDSIKLRYEQYICNYADSMELVTTEEGKEVFHSLPLVSLYTDNENYLRISDWVWKRKGGYEKFSFDSEAELEWAEILKELSHEAVKKIPIEERDPEIFDDEAEVENVYLWGKNYPYGSEIKFEYYLNGTHASYPDFVLKDNKNRIHLFEVKSVNVKSNSGIDTEEYKAKVKALHECYKQCSKLTGQVFYLPLLDGEDWKISRFLDGEEKTLSEKEFKKFVLG